MIKSKKSDRFRFITVLSCVAAFIAVVAVPLSLQLYTFNQEQHVTCSVTDKDPRLPGVSTAPNPLRVYSKDCEVFVIEDIPIRGFFNTADVYGKIQPGHRYEFITYGVRVPMFSLFPHIVQVEEVNDGR